MSTRRASPPARAGMARAVAAGPRHPFARTPARKVARKAAAARPAQPPFIVTAFEPFDGRTRNRSMLVLERVLRDPQWESAILPVDFLSLPGAITDLAERKPRALLLMGEADRDKVSVEQVAVNVIDSESGDNAGRVWRGRPVVPEGELALRASWDACALADTMLKAGIPAAPSFHAGTYACNAALYRALAELAPQGIPVGFLHVPRTALKLAMLVRAALAAIRALEKLAGAAAR